MERFDAPRSPFGAAAFLLLALVGVVVLAFDVGAAFAWRSAVMAGLGFVVLGLVVLGAYESWSLTGAGAPITWMERWAHIRHPLVWPLLTLVIGIGEGAVAGHFWWSVCPPPP